MRFNSVGGCEVYVSDQAMPEQSDEAMRGYSDEATERRSDAGVLRLNDFSAPFVAPSLRRCVASGSRSFASARRPAFSLVEIMVVVVIIGLMAGLVTYAVTHYLDRAKVTKAKADLGTLAGAVDGYYTETGRFPSTQEGLAVLAPKYVKVVPMDPWSHPYQYVQPGRSGPYDIICYGADGREGGTGPDADITSGDLQPAQKK